MKTVKIKKPWFELIASMDVSDIANSYYGSCNLTASKRVMKKRSVIFFAESFFQRKKRNVLY